MYFRARSYEADVDRPQKRHFKWLLIYEDGDVTYQIKLKWRRDPWNLDKISYTGYHTLDNQG